MGHVTLVIPTMLYAAMGIPVAKAIQHRVPYRPLILVTGASVLFVEFIAMTLQWNALTEQRQQMLNLFQGWLTGPESESLSEQAYQQLNMQIWVLEHWKDVFIGIAFSSALIGACLSIGWIYRALRRGHFEPVGSFSEFRPYDTTVWIVIATAAIAFIHYRSPNPWLQAISYNTALGLFTLYSLNGLAIVIHGLKLWKPRPLLTLACIVLLMLSGGLVTLAFLGLFDTWSDFRQRMNERARAANDSQDHLE